MNWFGVSPAGGQKRNVSFITGPVFNTVEIAPIHVPIATASPPYFVWLGIFSEKMTAWQASRIKLTI